MKLFNNGNCWIIEDYLNLNLVNEIKNIIEVNLDNLYENKEGYSTKGNNSYQYWFINPRENLHTNCDNFYKFVSKYTDEILSRIKEANLLNEERKKNIILQPTGAWSVIGEEGSYHTIHCHNGAYFDGISTLLYLEIPETNKKEEKENNTYLVVNTNPRNPFYDRQRKVFEINPEVGKLLIFPDWVLHGTYPQTKGVRQTFNVDYKLLFEKNKDIKFSYN